MKNFLLHIYALISAFFYAPLTWSKSDPAAGGDAVPNHYVRKFDDDVKLTSQQIKSRLEGAVMADYAVVGSSKSFDTLGSSEAQLVTGRNQDINYNNTDHGRRWIDMSDYDWADYIDTFDKLKILESPVNKYITLGVAAMNRAKDRVIITAASGSARSTTVAGVTETASLVVLPAAQKVAVGGTNLTLAKIRTAIELLNAAEAGSPEEGGERTFVYTANQLTKLMADSTLTSSDYNSLKALQNYNMGDGVFMGMKWVRSELVGKSGNVRYCPIICKEGVGLGVGANVTTNISQLTSKRGQPYQAYVMQSIGAVRGRDNCVVEIACDETA